MKRIVIMAAFAAIFLAAAPQFASPARAQPSTEDAARNATRERVRQTLQAYGPKINVDFSQSTKNPYNFVGVMKGLKNVESLEIVVSVTKDETVGFRVWPHFKGGYINLARASDRAGLMRQLLQFSDDNFLFWGADDSSDVFSGYTITLESGYPDEAVRVVLASVANTDKFVGQMRPMIDGSAPAN